MSQSIIALLRNNLFADRGEDIADALHYADSILTESHNKAACYTALRVVLNTVANAIEKADAQRAEQTAPAQLALDQLIDQRIKKWADAELEIHISDYLNANIEDHIDVDEKIKNHFDDEFDLDELVRDVLKNASISIDI